MPDVAPDVSRSGWDDEFAGFADAPAPAADEFAEFADAPTPAADEFSAFPDADDLDVQSVEELTANRDKFSPKDYFAANPDVARDPKKLAKLIDVYRKRDKEGLSATGVAKAVATETLPTLGKIAGGVRDLAAAGIEMSVQPIATGLGAIFTGDIFSPQKTRALVEEQGRRMKKAVVEAGAASELSATGMADLARTGLRKFASRESNLGLAGTGLAKEDITGAPKLEKSDQEILRQMSADVEFGKQLGEVARGGGEALKAFGLDADTLVKDGITLDPETIERLSLVDPLTIVAGGGVFKGIAAGRTIFTAASREAAQTMVNRLGQAAAKTAAFPVKVAGATAELAGTVVRKTAPAARLAGAVTGLAQGGPIGGLAGERAGAGASAIMRKAIAPVLEKSGAAVKDFGTALGNSTTFQKALVGGGEAMAGAAPFALASDDDKTAGAILGAGGALGGIVGGAVGAKQSIATRVSKAKLAPADIVYPPTESKPYGVNENLDVAHAAAIEALPPASQNTINAFRETVRDLGGEVYVLDPDVFQQTVLEQFERSQGRSPNEAEIAAIRKQTDANGYFDTTLPSAEGQPTRRAIFLNNASAPVFHETGHLFKNLLSPERQADLVQTARESYTPEQIAEFKTDYETNLGRQVSEDYILDEIITENFNQLFRNTPLSELTTPPKLLKKIGNQVVDFAESLGLDLTAGERTEMGLSSSLRLNNVVRDAAREVLGLPKPPVVEPVVRAPRQESIPLSEIDQALIETEPVTPTVATESVAGVEKVTSRKAAPKKPVVEPDLVAEVPEKPAPEPAPADEARAIAQAAPDTALPGANMSQREILGAVAESIAGDQGVRYNYRSAPEAPGAALEAERVTRRAEIEQARNMPEDVRRMVETTGFPYRVERTKNGVVQVLDYAPDMLAANAVRWAKALSELAVKDPNNAALRKVKYGLDIQKGDFTEQGWRDLMRDSEIFSGNQRGGFTGSGRSLKVPENVRAAGMSAPAERGVAVPLDQAAADFINLLYNLRVPETPRVIEGKMPGNLVAQRVSAETLPGRVGIPSLVEPKKPGGKAKPRKPFDAPYAGEKLREVNPLRGELEKALQAAKIGVPKGIEVLRRLNLEHIADVMGEPNLPRTAGGNSLTLSAGFQPKPGERSWRLTGQQAGSKKQIVVDAPDPASARRIGESRGMRVASVEAQDKTGGVNFQPKPGERSWKVSGQLRGSNTQILVDAVDMAAARKIGEAKGMRVAKIEAEDKTGGVNWQPKKLAEQIEKLTPEEFRNWAAGVEGGFTKAAHDLGRAADSRELVDSFKDATQTIGPKAMEALKAQQWDDASALSSQAQFFRESWEAATGTGSAGQTLRQIDPTYEPPWPVESNTTFIRRK